MPQARGSQAVIALYEESTYATTPGSPAGIKLYVTSMGVQAQQNRPDSNTLTGSRERSAPGEGNINVSGPVGVEIGAESIGTLLKHSMGTHVTGRSISNQPTNVTGVEVLYASAASATGNGTLTYANAATTLTWAESGDTAGAAVDVSAGGTFTLLSTSGESIVVEVTAGSLPGTDQNDADITVSTTGYTHTLTLGDLPTGMILEKDFGSNISGSGRVQYFNGCRISNVGFEFPQEGYCTASFDVLGAKETLASSALDASLTDNGHTSFSAFSASIEEGGASIASVTQANISLNNELDETVYTIGSNGQRSALPEGFATVTGSITALFDSAALLAKAVAGTESNLRITLTRGTGDGSDGNESIDFHVQQMLYERTSPAIEGPQGVRITLNFKAYYSGTSSALKVTLKNALSAI